MRLLDFFWCGLLLQLASAVVIAGFAGTALLSFVVDRDVMRARILVAQGVIGGLGLMTVATLLRTIGLRTLKEILMFSVILSLRVILKRLFVWERARITAEAGPPLQQLQNRCISERVEAPDFKSGESRLGSPHL